MGLRTLYEDGQTVGRSFQHYQAKSINNVPADAVYHLVWMGYRCHLWRLDCGVITWHLP